MIIKCLLGPYCYHQIIIIQRKHVIIITPTIPFMSSTTSFLDSVFDSLLPYFIDMDWSFIHLIIALPFVLMLVNYLNGGCDVAEAAGLNQNHQTNNNDDDEESMQNQASFSFFDKNPRVGLGIMVAAFFWQIHCVWFICSRYYFFASSSAQEQQSPPLVLKFLNLHSDKAFVGTFRIMMKALFYIHMVSCIFYLVCCIVIWKRAGQERRENGISTYKEYLKQTFGGAEKEPSLEEQVEKLTLQVETQQFDDETRVSYCRKCRTALVGRDHHCRWLAVCVGARTRYLYIASIIFAFLFSFADVVIGSLTIPLLDEKTNLFERYYVLIGYAFAAGACAFLAYQVTLQAVLVLGGQTKVGRSRRRELMKMRKELVEMKKKTR